MQHNETSNKNSNENSVQDNDLGLTNTSSLTGTEDLA